MSARYDNLVRQILDLVECLLPYDPTQDIVDLTNEMSIRAISFRMLAHAEFESYFEDRALAIALSCDASFKARRHISATTFAMIGFSGSNMSEPPQTAVAPPKKKDHDWSKLTKLDYRLSKSITDFYQKTQNDNHGIKEKNILSMLLPLGIHIDEIDASLLNELNNFGSKRGESAHSSTAGQLKSGVNPFDEIKAVHRLLLELIPLDEVISAVAAKAA